MLTGPLLHRLAAKRKGKRKGDLGGEVEMGIRIVIVQGVRYIPRAKKNIIYCVVQSTDESELFFYASSD